MEFINKKGKIQTILAATLMVLVQAALIALWNYKYISDKTVIFILLNAVIGLLGVMIVVINRGYKIANKGSFYPRWALFTGLIGLILLQLEGWDILDNACVHAEYPSSFVIGYAIAMVTCKFERK